LVGLGGGSWRGGLGGGGGGAGAGRCLFFIRTVPLLNEFNEIQ